MIGKKINIILKEFDHFLLLFSLLMVLAYPIWAKFVNHPVLWGEILTLLTIISGSSVTYSRSKTKVSFRLVFGVLVFAISFINIVFRHNKTLLEIVAVFQVLYYLVIAVFLFRLILRTKDVTTEVLVNTISGYFLLGLSWAVIVLFWNSLFPGSFSFDSDFLSGNFNEIYYAFVTMTTLGYGDYLPLDTSARAISVLIAITGSFYTTIVLAIIVGKFISSKTK